MGSGDDHNRRVARKISTSRKIGVYGKITSLSPDQIADLVYFLLCHPEVAAALDKPNPDRSFIQERQRIAARIAAAPQYLTRTVSALQWVYHALEPRLIAQLTLSLMAAPGSTALLRALTHELGVLLAQVKKVFETMPPVTPGMVMCGTYALLGEAHAVDGPLPLEGTVEAAAAGVTVVAGQGTVYGGNGVRGQENERLARREEGVLNYGTAATPLAEHGARKAGVGWRIHQEHLSQLHHLAPRRTPNGQFHLARSSFYSATHGYPTYTAGEFESAYNAHSSMSPTIPSPTALPPDARLFADLTNTPTLCGTITEHLLVTGGFLAEPSSLFRAACDNLDLVIPDSEVVRTNLEAVCEDRTSSSWLDSSAQAERGRKGGATRGEQVKKMVAEGGEEADAWKEKLLKGARKDAQVTNQRRRDAVINGYLGDEGLKLRTNGGGSTCRPKITIPPATTRDSKKAGSTYLSRPAIEGGLLWFPVRGQKDNKDYKKMLGLAESHIGTITAKFSIDPPPARERRRHRRQQLGGAPRFRAWRLRWDSGNAASTATAKTVLGETVGEEFRAVAAGLVPHADRLASNMAQAEEAMEKLLKAIEEEEQAVLDEIEEASASEGDTLGGGQELEAMAHSSPPPFTLSPAPLSRAASREAEREARIHSPSSRIHSPSSSYGTLSPSHALSPAHNGTAHMFARSAAPSPTSSPAGTAGSAAGAQLARAASAPPAAHPPRSNRLAPVPVSTAVCAPFRAPRPAAPRPKEQE
ncbi:hypothetical protein JCM10207_007869 [Rhodosporidiobolus poonsookiae]